MTLSNQGVLPPAQAASSCFSTCVWSLRPHALRVVSDVSHEECCPASEQGRKPGQGHWTGLLATNTLRQYQLQEWLSLAAGIAMSGNFSISLFIMDIDFCRN